MDTQSHSPIKALFRNHSPFRNKDKPLPDLPTDVSPAREPGAEISANVAQASPPRRGRSSGGFLAKLLGSTKTRSAVTGSQQAQSGSNYSLSSEVRTQAPPRSPADDKAKASRSPIRKSYFSKSKTSDPIRTLSRKVSDLESQLNKARKELDAAAGRKQPEAQDQPAEYERKMEEKVQSLSQRGRFNGLVENLLGQAPAVAVPQANTTLSPSKEPSVVYAGPVQAPGSPSEADNNLKRKRSVPDAPDLSWEHMQKNIAAFQMQAKVPNKRARTSLDSIRDDEPSADTIAAENEQKQQEADAKRKKKKAHRDMPADPTAFNKMIRLDREQEAQRAAATAAQPEEKEQQERDIRPKSRRSTKKPTPDFSSFGQPSDNTNSTSRPTAISAIPALSPSSIHLQAWPAPHSLSRAFSPPAEASSSPPASSPRASLDACAPHLPPSLAAPRTATGPDMFELHSDSSDSSDSDDADAATRRDRRRAEVDAWRAANGLGGEDEDSEEDEDEDDEGRDVPLATLAKPPVRRGRLVPKPSRLSRVVEEFEWDDGETF